MKAPRDLRKKSNWFRSKKILRKLKYWILESEQSERYFFSSDPVGFANLRISNVKNFAGDRQEVRAEIRF